MVESNVSVKVCALIYIFMDFHGCTDDVDINIKKKAFDAHTHCINVFNIHFGPI